VTATAHDAGRADFARYEVPLHRRERVEPFTSVPPRHSVRVPQHLATQHHRGGSPRSGRRRRTGARPPRGGGTNVEGRAAASQPQDLCSGGRAAANTANDLCVGAMPGSYGALFNPRVNNPSVIKDTVYTPACRERGDSLGGRRP
jgi:hypothetical protein